MMMYSLDASSQELSMTKSLFFNGVGQETERQNLMLDQMSFTFFCIILLNIEPSHENGDSRVSAQSLLLFIPVFLCIRRLYYGGLLICGERVG